MVLKAGMKLPFIAPKPAVFELHRVEDDSGISGTGHVLDGVVFPDGTTVVRWRGKYRSTAMFKNYRNFEKIHMAYHGSSVIKWVDDFNGLEFSYNYLQHIVTILGATYNVTKQENKYIVAKLKQVISSKVTELRELRNGKEISISQNRGESQTSLGRIDLDPEFTSLGETLHGGTTTAETSQVPGDTDPTHSS